MTRPTDERTPGEMSCEVSGETSTSEWVGRGRAAWMLGVSQRRLRRLVRDRTLSAPQPRDGAEPGWSRAEVDAVADMLAGRVTSVDVVELVDAPVALTRTLDRVIDDEFVLHDGQAVVQQLHVRVWDGLAPEGRRVVVVLGVLSGAVVDRVGAPARIAARWLPVPAPEALWVLFRPAEDGAFARLDGLRCYWDHDHPHQLRPAAYATPGGAARQVDTRSLTFARLEAVIGQPVECFPAAAYTADTVARYARHGRTVDVVHDDLGLARFTRAIVTLEDVVHGLADGLTGTEGAAAAAGGEAAASGESRVRDARAGVALLADEIRVRWDLRAGLAHDGTSTWVSGPGEGPRCWGARIVPVTDGGEHAGLFDRYPDPFPVGDDDRVDRLALLTRWWEWADEIGPHSDRPDPALRAALDTAAGVLTHWLAVRGRGSGPAAPEQPHRRSEVRTYTVHGDLDQEFLDRLIPADPVGQPGAGAALRRRARAVAAPFTNHHRWALHELQFGCDRDGHLVAAEPYPAAGYRSRDYAAEWPLGAMAEPLPEDAALVSDAGNGDRPVYIRWPNRTLSPMPGRPDGQVHAGWNFGYSGSGPDQLAEDIVTLLSTGDVRDDAGLRRVVAELSRDHHQPRMNLSVSELITRLANDPAVRPAPSGGATTLTEGREQRP